MSETNINWYPGHMAKTRRMLEEYLKQVDAVCELLDARIPRACRNPDIAALCGQKPRMIVLNRSDMADPDGTARWAAALKKEGYAVLATDCKNRKGVNQFVPAVRSLLGDKLTRYADKGLVGKQLKLMIVGIPNVGKSTLINQVAKNKSAKAENRPGVTRGKQWITVDQGLRLLDTPGILWPKLDDDEVARHLAYTGAINDEVSDCEWLACSLARLLWEKYPDAMRARYGIDVSPDAEGYEILEACGRKRGFLVSGGEVHTERMAKTLLEEFRSGKLGRFTLEEPQ